MRDLTNGPSSHSEDSVNPSGLTDFPDDGRGPPACMLYLGACAKVQVSAAPHAFKCEAGNANGEGIAWKKL